jgi:hypothetical protein
VAIPKTTSPPVPVITSIAGGENQITVKWAKNPGAAIAGYLLYKTQDIQKAGDWRRMELIKINDADAFTVAVNGNLPAKEFEFMDTSAVARQAYYYGVVAVGLSDEGKHLKSKMSAANIGQAWDDSKPEIEDIELSHNVVDNSEAIVLAWMEATTDYECELKRSPGWSDGESRHMIYDAGNGQYKYTDIEVNLAEAYQYQVTVRTSNGQEADVKVQVQVIP